MRAAVNGKESELMNLAEARARALLTQGTLAKKAGMTEKMVADIEAGYVVAPPSTIRKLAAALHVYDSAEIDEFRAGFSTSIAH
jgi:ribosome-binding protein aMBF1 (putative translation factor)